MSQTIQYFGTAFATVAWDVNCRAAFITWHKYASAIDYRLIMTKALELLEKENGSQILVDNTNRGVIDLADQKWTVEDWYPRAAAIGYKRVAMVNPTNVVTKMSINRVMKQLSNTGLDEGHFTTLEEARAWLKQKISPNSTVSLSPKSSEMTTANESIYYENDYIVIGWVESGRYAYGRWKKFAGSANFRFGLEKVAEFLNLKQVVGYLADLRLAGIITLEDQKWLAEEWRRSLPKSLRRVAQLTPQSATVSLAAKRLARQSNDEHLVQVFFDEEAEAVAWLLELTIEK